MDNKRCLINNNGMKECPSCGFSSPDTVLICSNCGVILPISSIPKDTSDPLIGKKIDNKYIIEEYIGEGGMGRVYRGKQRFLDKLVAIKILHGDNTEDERAVAMFYREARLAAKLNHPNSITIYDFGQTDEGIIYMVMEFLRGESLSNIIKHEKSIPLNSVASWVRQILLALEAAHRIGLVHRDLKPENIFVEKLQDGSDHVTVLDFGIAKQLDSSDNSLTRPGMVWGTPEYMSPEQATGKALDGRTDLYSLGIMFYEMVCGRPPYVSENPTEVLISHVHEKPAPPSKFSNRKIPPALEAIIMWSIEKKKDDRITTAAEFRRILEGWMAVSSATDLSVCPICSNSLPPSCSVCPSCLHAINIPSVSNQIITMNTLDIVEVDDIVEDETSREDSYDWLESIEIPLNDEVDDSSSKSGKKKSVTGLYTSESSGELKTRSDHIARPHQVKELEKLIKSSRNIHVRGIDGSGRTFVIVSALENCGSTYYNINLEESGRGLPWSLERSLITEFLGMDFITRYSEKAGIYSRYIFELLSCNPQVSNIRTWKLQCRKAICLFVDMKLRKEKTPCQIHIHGTSDYQLDIDFIEQLSDIFNNNKSVLIIESLPDLTSLPGFIDFKLDELSDSESVDLFTRFTGHNPSTSELRSLLNMNGNILYMMQFIDLQGEEQMPAVLNNPSELLEIRYSRLPERMREILGLTSLVDGGFSTDEYARILDTEEDNLRMPLKLLESRGLIYRRNDTWNISHSHLRQVISSQIPMELKRNFCSELTKMHETGIIEISPAVIGDLYFESGDYARSFEIYAEIASNYKTCSDHSEIKYLKKAILSFKKHISSHGEVYKRDINTLYTSVESWVNILNNEGHFSKVEAALLEILNLLEKEKHLHLRFLMLLFTTYIDQGEFTKAKEVFDIITTLESTEMDYPAHFILSAQKLFQESGSVDNWWNFLSQRFSDIFKTSLMTEIFLNSASGFSSNSEVNELWMKTAWLCSFDNLDARVLMEGHLSRTLIEKGSTDIAVLHTLQIISEYENNDMLVEVFETISSLLNLLYNTELPVVQELLKKAEQIADDLNWKKGQQNLLMWKSMR
ncbi:serine/threonine protein kinase [Myxococcota bacterium]|nr:serine/threonine protein kinase [Myxococcota bacterium]MBU1382306.1 serine/threonine protein kinase [Myxococcota bacterium]MBU1498462.1 serine/threonine protein kinase [Myxococcota bacterium]